MVENLKTEKIKGEGDDEFIQASGVTIDNRGNYLVIDSMTSRVMAFRADGLLYVQCKIFSLKI